MESNKLLDLARKQYPLNPPVVQIHNTSCDVKEGISKSSKQPYKISTQTAYLHTENSLYPREFQINLDTHMPFSVGFYVLDLSLSLEFDNYGALVVNSRNLSLLPIADF